MGIRVVENLVHLACQQGLEAGVEIKKKRKKKTKKRRERDEYLSLMRVQIYGQLPEQSSIE